MRAFTLGSGLGGLAITGITVVITVVTMGVILMATPTILTGTGIRITETTADTGTRAITVDTAAGATAVIMAVGVVTQGSDAAVVVDVAATVASGRSQLLQKQNQNNLLALDRSILGLSPKRAKMGRRLRG